MQLTIKTKNAKKPVLTHPAILYVGSMMPHKGLYSMSYVAHEIPEVRLFVVTSWGGKEHEDKVKRMIENLKLEEKVKLLGNKENREILELIRESDIVVICEQWPNEFGPIILMEAKALGEPVVAGRIGGIPEFIEDGVDGLCVTYNEPQEFAQKIIYLLKDKKTAEALGKNAGRSAEFLYSNREATQRIIKLYHSLIPQS